MKRFACLFFALLMPLLLIGCGSSASTPKDYPAILQSARAEDFNEAYPVFSKGADGTFAVTGGGSDAFSPDDTQNQGQMVFDLLNLTAEDTEDFAVSASLMNLKSYGVAIVKPADGRTDAVTSSLQTFVQQQMQAQERYLPDQYEIACDARIFTAKGGEVVLVMSENAADVANKLQAAL